MTDEAPVRTGRQIRLVPLRPGLWGVILGTLLAGLAPLAGFLVGSILGTGSPGTGMSPMAVALFVGILVGALGVLVALLSAFRMMRARPSVEVSEA